MSGVEPVAALTTKRLQLRPPVASDATAITAILNDFEISMVIGGAVPLHAG